MTLSGNGIVQGTNRVTCNINYKTWNQFLDNANRFMNITSESILQDLSPGGYYEAIWTRDAAYIININFFLVQLSILY